MLTFSSQHNWHAGLTDPPLNIYLFVYSMYTRENSSFDNTLPNLCLRFDTIPHKMSNPDF